MTTKQQLLNQIACNTKNIVATLDRALALPTMDAKTRWITTESGSHILVDGDGNIVGGAGGKFNGKPLSSMGGTKKFTKYETNAERTSKTQFSHESTKKNLINAVKEHKYGTPAFNKEWKKHEAEFNSLSDEQQEDIKNNLREAIANWKPKHHSGVQSILKEDKRIKGTTGAKGATLKDNEIKFLNDIAEKEKLSEKQANWLKIIAKKMNINVSIPETKKSKPTTQSNALGSYEDADMPEYDKDTGKWYDLETGLEIAPPMNPYARKTYL